MIVVKIDGGLGNQMFQYAYGLYHAQRLQTALLLDLREYEHQPAHGYLLDRFQIQAEVATGDVLRRLPRRYRNPDARRGGFFNWLGQRPLRRHKESPFGFAAKHLKIPDDSYLIGYWQSERFFPGIESTLRKHFCPRLPLSPASQQVADHMRSTNSIALHVRRGDYITHSTNAAIYEHLQLDYYLHCLNDWAARQSDSPEVFIFSNDIAWCRKHFQLAWPTRFVDHNHGNTAHEDMLLISQAASCVIANSTFSWWSAWLNARSDHTIYAPPRWFRSGTLDDRHIIPDRWERCVPHPELLAPSMTPV